MVLLHPFLVLGTDKRTWQSHYNAYSEGQIKSVFDDIRKNFCHLFIKTYVEGAFQNRLGWVPGSIPGRCAVRCPAWTDCDKAGDYVVPNLLSQRDLVSRPDNMEETVPHTRLGEVILMSTHSIGFMKK